MRTLFSWLVAALLLGSPAGHAANWFTLDTLDARSALTIETDIDSLRQTDRRRELTVRVSYPDARQHPGGAWYRSVVATVEFECDEKQADYRDAVFYAKAKGRGAIATREDGRLATSEAAGELLPPKNLELLIRAACARPTPAVR